MLSWKIETSVTTDPTSFFHATLKSLLKEFLLQRRLNVLLPQLLDNKVNFNERLLFRLALLLTQARLSDQRLRDVDPPGPVQILAYHLVQ